MAFGSDCTMVPSSTMASSFSFAMVTHFDWRFVIGQTPQRATDQHRTLGAPAQLHQAVRHSLPGGLRYTSRTRDSVHSIANANQPTRMNAVYPKVLAAMAVATVRFWSSCRSTPEPSMAVGTDRLEGQRSLSMLPFPNPTVIGCANDSVPRKGPSYRCPTGPGHR